MADLQWARVKGVTNCGLRRGAWYRVLELSPRDATLAVPPQPVSLPRNALQFLSVPPYAWAVVAQPRDATGRAATWGGTYVVCPRCQTRAPLTGGPQWLRCPCCDGLFRVAWEEWFIGPP
jgi:hypothetical protein